MKFEEGKLVVSDKGDKYLVQAIKVSQLRDGSKYLLLKSLGPKFLKRNGDGREFITHNEVDSKEFGVDDTGNEYAYIINGSRRCRVVPYKEEN